jgi:hypothetical protein
MSVYPHHAIVGPIIRVNRCQSLRYPIEIAICTRVRDPSAKEVIRIFGASLRGALIAWIARL